ncbi:MAG: 2-C-methyl-D-erythritol 4-phosphate cytidylyltransferase [Xanthomonadales bacterium]|nr:2-C-methyl-D-erythritol 4-phosphate cytidylyltransferase [Xanthomonadales bacterium]
MKPGKAKRPQIKVSAIIDARSRMPDGTLIAGLRLDNEHLLDRQMRLLQGEVDEYCVLGGEELSVAAEWAAKGVHRVAGIAGMSGLSDALAETRGRSVLLFSAAQPFPEIGECRRVLASLRKRPVAGVFQGGRMSLARAQGATVLSSTPSDDYWTAQLPLGFERALLGEVLGAAKHTKSADQMNLCEITLRLGHAIALVEGRRSGFLIRDSFDWTLAQALAVQARAAA